MLTLCQKESRNLVVKRSQKVHFRDQLWKIYSFRWHECPLYFESSIAKDLGS